MTKTRRGSVPTHSIPVRTAKRHYRTRLAPLLVAAVALLAGCAPTAEAPRAQVEQLSQAVSYYPQETGATWNYLPENAKLDEPPVYRRVDGPTILGGEVVTVTRLVGRGLDEHDYRRYTPEGVFLERRTKPGTIIDFEPAIQEFPPAGQLRVGASWGGTTRAEIHFPQARPENQRASLDITYRYEVVDRRPVSVPAGTFEVFVINLVTEAVGDDGNVADHLTQATWFVPYVGEVRTEGGLYLVEMNFEPQTP